MFILDLPIKEPKKSNMTVGMLCALFSCNFSTISVAALCQAVLWVDHCGGGRTEINMNYHHNLHCTPLWCRYIWIISAQNLILLGQKDYSNLHSTNMYSTSLRRSTYDLWCSTYSQHNYFLYPLKFSAPASKKLVCVRSGAILWQGISAICMQRLPRRAKKWAKTCEKWHVQDFVQTKLPNLESTSFCHVLTIFRSASEHTRRCGGCVGWWVRALLVTVSQNTNSKKWNTENFLN